MAFESLSDKLQNAFKKLKGKGVLTEADINDAMREVKLALLEADVNFKVVKGFVNDVKEKCLGTEVLESLTPAQQIIKIVNQELVELMGGTGSKLTYSPSGFTTIMMVGLQGTGKTTTCGKLANYLKQHGKKPMMCACDIYRPAAIDQLEVVGKSVNTPVFTMRDSKEPAKIALAAKKEAEKKGFDVLIVDTAGRLQIDQALMDELVDIKGEVKPHEILLVVDALTGQDAVNVAEGFNEKLGVDGIVMTKMDGDSRGGAALSAKKVTGKPIKFMGVGEKFDALEPFHPERMASRILGMGDMLSLIEKAEQAFDQEKAEKLEERLKKNQFTLEDFLDQMGQVKNMGGIGKILEMMPGVSAAQMKGVDLEESEKEFRQMEAIIQSMTIEERQNPNILNASRRKRIAAGCGQPVSKINNLIKRYEEMKKMVKQLSNPKAMKKNKLFRGLF
ncbi:signal recognition particle protein [Anaerovoracaceae bacterium 41-7]|jgi:signal recognition particle subunit SRP54|uniref:Signal recognition particle protein n=1 Tax=Anaerotruncus colihominis TaxID=169435 RepID=A0A845QJW0_9FIRM|nr:MULTISPECIES: signal recognition particle protein [Clostridia]MCI9476126.1 signal recognition particle protein [Emergencia sp.]MCI9640265.1 signal recognition particle protein [Emergencia sp.]NBH60977.1 signal recognition particle protein [Anaerotruncus colihominis]NCE98500.1 signal recognition particle protein [Emergencia sp. 1XD21-10]NCF01632.1 signal recognition particle protein [Anaerotruncus sp. 80]